MKNRYNIIDWTVILKPFYGLGFGYMKQKVKGIKRHTVVFLCIRITFWDNF